jgi:hypothetical protein
VKPAPPFIFLFAVSDKAVRRGDPVTMCYGVEHTTSVRLEPLNRVLALGRRNCIFWYPSATMTYTLTATGDAGRTDKVRFTVGVH